MKRFMLILSLGLIILAAGCTVTTDANGAKHYALNTNASDKVEGAAQVGVTLAPLFGPIGMGIAGVLAGALGAWRKVKPTLTEAKTMAEQSHAAAKAVVDGLEEFKKTNPDTWAMVGTAIEAQLQKQNIDPLVIENVIRGLRGLPAKS